MIHLIVMQLHKRVGGFGYAWKGIKTGWEEEANFRFQTACAAVAVAFGLLLGISRIEWLVLFLTIGLVLTAELINTSLEELCDMYKAEHDPHIEKIKDVAAGAVFLSSWVSILAGAFIFLPRIWTLFS